ncbi:MAG: hypothetical protein Q7J06_11975 [Bacteroidales bacterium]|nr:hypothetical protein [Bacteroidales bacterium]
MPVKKLALADSKHLGAAGGTDALGSRLAILHGDALGVLHLFFSAAFYAICFHLLPPSQSLY